MTECAPCPGGCQPIVYPTGTVCPCRTPIAQTDSDRDGLTYNDEITRSLSTPTIADSNGATIIDSVVFQTGHTIANSDYDGDTLDGAAEKAKGTSPVLADTDGDGVRDDADVFALDPTRSTAPPTSTSAPVFSVSAPQFATVTP